MVAELLGVPAATALTSVEIVRRPVSGERATDGGDDAGLGAAACGDLDHRALPDARFPNFKGIMAAKKKPFETLTLADLGVDAG